MVLPIMSKTSKLTERINLVADEAQVEKWRAAAQASGLTLSAWMRMRCDGTAAVVAQAPNLTKAA